MLGERARACILRTQRQRAMLLAGYKVTPSCARWKSHKRNLNFTVLSFGQTFRGLYRRGIRGSYRTVVHMDGVAI